MEGTHFSWQDTLTDVCHHETYMMLPLTFSLPLMKAWRTEQRRMLARGGYVLLQGFARNVSFVH